MPHNETVQKFLSILGPFYEYVDENERLESVNKNATPLNSIKQENNHDLIMNGNKKNGFVVNSNDVSG